MQARGPQWETDGKGKRGFYPTDWRPKVKRILIWLDFASQERLRTFRIEDSRKGFVTIFGLPRRAKKDHKGETPCTQTGQTPLQHWGCWFYLMNEFSRTCNTPLIMPAESSGRLALEIPCSRGSASPGASCGCGIRSCGKSGGKWKSILVRVARRCTCNKKRFYRLSERKLNLCLPRSQFL